MKATYTWGVRRPGTHSLRGRGTSFEIVLCYGLVACVSCVMHASPPALPSSELPLEANAAGISEAESQPSASTGEGAIATALPQIDIPEIDALVGRALAEQRMPGAVVVVGRRDGVVFQRAYGRRAVLPAPAEMTEDTIFDLASLTKPIVTGALIQHLAERGLLDVDDPVIKHLPEFGSHGKRAITIRHLLTHTGGLPIVNPLEQYADGPLRALQRIYDVRPEFSPGSRYLYGDLSYIVLGALIERVAREPLDALSDRVLFQPLGMRETRFRPDPGLKPRIAPTELAKERPIPLIHGEAHDPRAWLLGGIAGNAGLFTTASDLARFARMLLGGGELEGVRVLSRQSVQELTRAHHLPGVVRTLGWDIESPHSKAHGQLLSRRAYGHGGYTGTSLWIDPERDLFVGFLSNRVHPTPEHSVVALQGEIADAAVRAVAPAAPECLATTSTVSFGIDVLRREGFASLRGKRVGLVTHRAAVASDGTSTLDVLRSAPNLDVVSLMSPEHGLEARGEGAISDSFDAKSALPVYSLYGKTLRPTREMVRDVDVLVVDLVDVGTRFYTYMSTLQQTLWAGAEHGIPVVVLDRPNPLGGVSVEGPLQDVGYENFVNHHRLPVRHGMTAGELAELINDERSIGARLEIVPASGWRREMLHAETRLPWQDPSPNLRGAETTFLYPAIGLVESTNVSVGRGTDRPFHIMGAPYINSERFLRTIEAAALPGVRFETVEFTPDAAPHRGERCHGVQATITDPRAFQPVRTGLVLARALWRHNRHHWQSHKLIRLVGNRAVVKALFDGVPLAELERIWAADAALFEARRSRFLRYPTCRQP